MRTACLLLCLIGLAPACLVSRTTTNEAISREALAKLRPGATTAAEVVELLGAPSEVVQLGKRSAYRYDHTVLKRAGFFALVIALLNDDAHADRAWVFFDERDVLTHFGATLRADQAEYGMPWSD